jgi:hypothetical protein
VQILEWTGRKVIPAVSLRYTALMGEHAGGDAGESSPIYVRLTYCIENNNLSVVYSPNDVNTFVLTSIWT